MKSMFLTALLLLATLSIPSFASVGVTSTVDPDVKVLKLSDLRSAYLIRAGVVRYDASSNSPDELRVQLQRHFDIVLALLQIATPHSVETALTRLEEADDHTWNTAERGVWRQELLARRYVQLCRLAAYRDAGQFPLNEGQSTHAVPIFVDHHDTACAVGHLMRLAGWTQEVDKIRTTNNLVYVTDVRQSSVAAWALTSGLTWEEAALIQPAYIWPVDYYAKNYEPGELAIERNGLRFENFQLSAVSAVKNIPPDYPPEFCNPGSLICFQPTPDLNLPTINNLGLLTGKGSYGSPVTYVTHNPTLSHWLALTGIGASAAENRAQSVIISFDVSAISPSDKINGMSETSYLYEDGFRDPITFMAPDAIYYLHSTLRDGPSTIATLSINQSTAVTGYAQKTATKLFSPKQKVNVQSELWLQDGVVLNTFLLDINVVPEPASGLLIALGITAVGVAAGRRRRTV